jgi:hypothetical protein
MITRIKIPEATITRHRSVSAATETAASAIKSQRFELNQTTFRNNYIIIVMPGTNGQARTHTFPIRSIDAAMV